MIFYLVLVLYKHNNSLLNNPFMYSAARQQSCSRWFASVRGLKVDRTALPAETPRFLLLWNAHAISMFNFFVNIALVCYLQAGVSVSPSQNMVQISADRDFLTLKFKPSSSANFKSQITGQVKDILG